MGLASETDEDVFKKHQELCNGLNMDKETANEAWQSYSNIRLNYTLEVCEFLNNKIIVF